ncbi:Uncharacterised protein [Vibrio cholerae]|nr:Uncharacterised protein [Vibrio cholerae]CSC72575.1 Uncharacterised protein [Vibrio cholerae]
MFNHPKLSNSSYCSFCLSLFTFILRVYFINVILKLIHQSLYALYAWRKLGKQVSKCSRNRCSFKSTNQGLGH